MFQRGKDFFFPLSPAKDNIFTSEFPICRLNKVTKKKDTLAFLLFILREPGNVSF